MLKVYLHITQVLHKTRLLFALPNLFEEGERRPDILHRDIKKNGI